VVSHREKMPLCLGWEGNEKGESLMTYKTIIVLGAAVMATALTACGATKGDRALSGAGIGAATGTAATVLTGGNPWTGAIVGGAVGAAAGAVTDKDDVNLGKPVWRK
jgi:osmotically inducible lipoprotein OsmB